VTFVGRFFRFWYDFIVGDDWKIAATIAGVLVAGAGAVANELARPAVLAPAIGALVAFGFLGGLIVDVRRRDQVSAPPKER
jgi:hypothetical protein